jgi:hypothetical protein
MMEARQGMYQFVSGLINLIWLFWPIAGPFVLMRVIIRVVRWAYSSARGERDADELRQEGIDNRQGLQNRINYGRSYRQLNAHGFSNQELRQIRGQRSGARFRF